MLFEYANVAMPKTTPSLFSLLSGLYPRTHRVYALGLRISDSIELLPEMLKRHGYRTGGVVGQFNCHRKFGFNRGFDFYDDDFDLEQVKLEWKRGKGERRKHAARFWPTSERRAETVVARSIAWLETARKEQDSTPIFLWMHLMDPHAAYDPPADFAARFDGDSPMSGNSLYGVDLRPDQIHIQAYDPDTTRLDDYLNRYDSEIAYLDHHLGVLFDHLKENDVYRDALIILTADHGEYMGENMMTDRFFHHGSTPFESETRVPLILKFPGNVFRGKRISTPTSLVDVVPSILEMIGESGTIGEGTSFLGQIDGRDLRPDATSFIQVSRGREMAVRRGNFKLIVHSPVDIDELAEKIGANQETALEFDLFDVVSDPFERNDVSATHPEIRDGLREVFLNWLATPAYSQRFVPSNRLDAESAAHLRALGYVDDAATQ